VVEAILKLKNSKATGLDGVAGEMLKRGEIVIVEWMVRVFNACWK